MKGFKVIALSLALGLVLTGCGSKEEPAPAESTSTTDGAPYKVDISDQTMTVEDGNGNIIAEDVIERDHGYTMDGYEDIISVSTTKENDKDFLVISGKKSGNAELTLYSFDPEDNECTSSVTYTLKVYNNLGVHQTGMDAHMGSCDKNKKDVTMLNT